ncbi:MAG: hypothetical protein KatS3mg110_3730 [Pirellulaceae bacterium]|nr:MAG: hypothetical protein KatS3mg110_3730 [Pirellulaceae bacterium]
MGMNEARKPGRWWLVLSFVYWSSATVALLLFWDLFPKQARAAEQDSAAFRTLAGKHLELVTDLPPAAETDELPAVFDAAVPLWAAYFGLPREQWQSFRPRAFLIKDAKRFRQAGLMPDDLPPFPTGFQRNGRIWLYEQPAAYYQRHLLLHEGVHAFCEQLLGHSGPPWYAEGIAEFLALHRWVDGKLQIGINPLAPEEVPFWGRIKLIRQAQQSGQLLSLADVMRFGPDAHRQVEPYAWSWAAVFFFENHPDYRDTFGFSRQLLAQGAEDFSAQLRQRYGSNWEQVELNWFVFVRELEFGYDVARAALRFEPPRAQEEKTPVVTLRADQGWLVTSIPIEKGETVRLTAEGRYQLAERPAIWWCEPPGVTLHYYRGKPLGVLLAAIVPDDRPTTMTDPIQVGRRLEWAPGQTGRLCLKINDSPALLADNAGTIRVRVEKSPGAISPKDRGMHP